MNNIDIVKKFLDSFCSSDIDGLEPLLHNNLSFRGTLYSFNSKTEYLKSLRDDPPEVSRYEILSLTESKDSVAIFYNYHKPNRIITIAQLFKIQENKIYDILLVLDGRIFA